MLKNSSADVWIQNIRLSILTLFFAGITMITTDGEAVFGGKVQVRSNGKLLIPAQIGLNLLKSK